MIKKLIESYEENELSILDSLLEEIEVEDYDNLRMIDKIIESLDDEGTGESIPNFKDKLNEEDWIKTDPKERGKWTDYTIKELEDEKSKLKKDNDKYQEKGEKVPQENIEKMSELNFAINAKKGKFKKKG